MIEVRVSDTAYRDMRRLAAFLAPKSPAAADRAYETIERAILSLSEMPDRGRRVRGAIREVAVRFGRDGYVFRYRVAPDHVLVTRIVHTREQR